MFWRLLIALCSFLALSTTAPGTNPSSHDSDIICHPLDGGRGADGAVDCYPRLFQPTNEFEIVRDDQEIPKGLHVRMDFQTGRKEAKLIDPEDDDNKLALTNTVEVFRETDVDSDSSEAEEAAEPVVSPSEGSLRHEDLFPDAAQKIMKSAIYEASNQDDIRPPPSGTPDRGSFAANCAILHSASSEEPDPEIVLPALEALEDVSHDIYWGLNLAKDGPIVRKLDAFIAANTTAVLAPLASHTSIDVRVKSAAALLLATAVQNNPAALTATLSHFYNDENPEGLLESVLAALLHEQMPRLLARLVFLLSELCQDQSQLLRFIEADGLVLLRNIFLADRAGDSETMDRLRGKVANFVLDHFLQKDSLTGVSRLSDDEGEEEKRMQKQRGTASKATAAETRLESEDPWILISPDDTLPKTSTHRQRRPPFNPKAVNIANQLVQWRPVFDEALSRWTHGKGSSIDEDTQTATAFEQVKEAKAKLQRKLSLYRCRPEETKTCIAS